MNLIGKRLAEQASLMMPTPPFYIMIYLALILTKHHPVVAVVADHSNLTSKSRQTRQGG